MNRRHLLFVVAFLCVAPVLLRAANPEQTARSITIYRDNYGVPHIYGPTDASCAFGYMYAQAEDNFWQIEDSYIRSLGRASEVYGTKSLEDDELVRALEIHGWRRRNMHNFPHGRRSCSRRGRTGSITSSRPIPR